LRARARATVVERYDLRRVCLPAQLRLLETLNRGQVRNSPVSPEPSLSK